MKEIILQIEDVFYDKLRSNITTKTAFFKTDNPIDLFTLATIKSIEAKATKMLIKDDDKVEIEFKVIQNDIKSEIKTLHQS